MSVGYSGTPLPKKLGIKEGHHLLVAGAPDGFEEHLEPLPSAVRQVRAGRTVAREDGGAELRLLPSDLPDGRFDVVLLFCPTAADLLRLFPSMVSTIRWNGGIWACWPKKSSPLHIDLADGQVRSTGLATGLVDNKVCAVTEDWSGLRFVVRRSDRPKSPDPEGGPSS